MTSVERTPFNYSYIPGPLQYSFGVRADSGHELVRVRAARTPPLDEGYRLIERYMEQVGLPVQAVCALELRSPEQFSEQGFKEFNEAYAAKLDEWRILLDGSNPVARSNVIPEKRTVSGPSVHSFTYVRPQPGAPASYVISGESDAPEGFDSYNDQLIAPGDTSPRGMRKKAEYVIGELLRRKELLGSCWDEVTDVQVYTLHSYESIHTDLSGMVPLAANIAWQYCAPPVEEWAFEMDSRRVHVEEFVQ